jgi:hypothetical protein
MPVETTWREAGTEPLCAEQEQPRSVPLGRIIGCLVRAGRRAKDFLRGIAKYTQLSLDSQCFLWDDLDYEK